MKRKTELDLIIIETTGLANPGPVAQTFFADEVVKEFARLDGIITMVDAKHVEQHLDDEKEGGAINEATEQVAFADRLLLNKIDLVPEEGALRRVEARLRMQRCRSNSRRAGWRQIGLRVRAPSPWARAGGLNKYAPIARCANAEVALSHVMDIQALKAGGKAPPSPSQHGAPLARQAAKRARVVPPDAAAAQQEQLGSWVAPRTGSPHLAPPRPSSWNARSTSTRNSCNTAPLPSLPSPPRTATATATATGMRTPTSTSTPAPTTATTSATARRTSTGTRSTGTRSTGTPPARRPRPTTCTTQASRASASSGLPAG